MDSHPVHAAVRFGLGLRNGEPAPSDPCAWLVGQLDAVDPLLVESVPDSGSAFDVWRREDAGNDRFAMRLDPVLPHFIGDRYQADRRRTVRNMIFSSQPFRERLVMFWANHFTISSRAGGGLLSLIGAYVQEAIRPHVTGRFEDMLRAVVHHPAMLLYLNNNDSVGPNSVVGRATKKGMNENLARECLELHTIGVNSGYTQQDVTSFARILTGWSFDRFKEPRGFIFYPHTHEPGAKTLMGRSYPEGREGGEAALTWLAHHPATHRRLADQLVRHFVADNPDPKDVERIASVLQHTNGDLRATAVAVTELPSAWTPLTKLRTPVEYVVAVYRGLGLPLATTDDQANAYWATEYLGQPYQAALLPNGWSDKATDWVGGDSLVMRADWVFDMAGKPNTPDPEMLGNAYRPLFSVRTLDRARLAGSRRESLALLLASPEFMRR
jgi:uncharacterized protein (DUF1800 family)